MGDATAGAVCLQGGAEFRPGCEPMDAAMLGPAAAPRRVLVAPYAGRPGRERQVAAANAERWYRGLGARTVAAVPEDRLGAVLARLAGPGDDPDDPDARGDLLVLPGGSPSRLLAALAPHRDALAAAVARGVALSGASAGAMVLCRWTLLPDGGTRRVAPGLGVVPVDLVVVHHRGGPVPDAARDVLPVDAVVLGLPERSGVVVRPDGGLAAAGVDGFRRLG